MTREKKLFVTNRDEWREWLRDNHATVKEIWLINYRKATGKPSIPYEDAVEEALCFGWIDSIIKKIDDEKFIRKFTPRKNRSKWSELSKKRAKNMIEAGKMTEAGKVKIREAKESGEWFKTTPIRKDFTIPQFIRDGLETNEKALEFFNSLANSYKRNIIGWVASAKREETRKKRLAEAISLLEQNKELG
ncbi:MAG: YdeI/OmpD-associated family protein, partial [Candidatus Bathyarchaeota archaeon]